MGDKVGMRFVKLLFLRWGEDSPGFGGLTWAVAGDMSNFGGVRDSRSAQLVQNLLQLGLGIWQGHPNYEPQWAIWSAVYLSEFSSRVLLV